MFDKFGEFGSCEELNRAAAGLREEGDWESLNALAEENGIDAADARDYMTMETEIFATPYTAALGRLAVYEKASKNPVAANMVIYTMIRSMLEDSHLQMQVMAKGKDPDSIYNAMREEASKARVGNVGIVCGTDRDLRERILHYYGGRA